MKNREAGVKGFVVSVAAALSVMTVLAAPALAQRSGRSTGMERRSEELNRRRDQLEREMQLRGVEPKSEDAEERPAGKATISQVKHDFERIQAIYNEIVRALAASKSLDYEFVSDATTEIKKCSTRLKNSLALPSSEQGDKSEQKQSDGAGDVPVDKALLALSNYIKSFITNPLFESSGVIDIKLSTMASHDLKKIIELSESIRKRADKLKD